MSKTFPTVPDYITRSQYVAMFAAMGLDPSNTIEVRAANDGVHALVVALDQDGEPLVDRDGARRKHRIFIPVRNDDGDRRTARITAVEG
jgi:hypothetical protein